MKFNEKIEAIRLRKLGKSYGEIRKKMHVSKSTLSLWLRGIKLTLAQEKRLYVTLQRRSAYKGAKVLQKKRIKRTEKIIKEAKREVKIFFRNPLFLCGLMLYWAEGSKRDSSEATRFSNSDPAMIKFMMRWFRDICRVPNEKFRIALHIHTLHCRKDIENYWSKITNIPLNQFQKTFIKPTSLKHRKNPLYGGTCNIVIPSKDLFRRIKGWKLGFLEKINMKNI